MRDSMTKNFQKIEREEAARAQQHMPSRPGEFHPEPLTDSGLDTLASSGSCHRMKAAAFR
jgi:hypothetical protein